MAENKTEATFSLAAIRERSNAATAGPWKVKRHGKSHVWVASDTVKYADGQLFMGHTVDQDILSDENYATKAADAEFVARAREDVPALCAVVERLLGFVQWVADDKNDHFCAGDIIAQAEKTLESLNG